MIKQVSDEIVSWKTEGTKLCQQLTVIKDHLCIALLTYNKLSLRQ